MELFAPYYTVPLAALSAWFGIRQGIRLSERGFTLRQRLGLRDLPGLTALIPLIVLLVPPLLLLRNYPEFYWYVPLRVQLYAGGFIWTLMLCSFLHLAAIMLALSNEKVLGYKFWVLFALVGLAFGAGYLVRQSPFFRPPELSEASVIDGVVLQTSDATCAAAAVANVAGVLGLPRTEREMVELMGSTAFGTSTAQVYDGLRKLGLGCKAKRISNRDFKVLHAPAILFVDFGTDRLGHAICYMGEKDGRAEIWNPQGGRNFQTQDQLATFWRGHALEVYRKEP